MKRKIFTMLLAMILYMPAFWAQSTELFETETSGSTSFTDNGQVFNITSQAQGPFDIQTAYAGTGWNGTAADNRYIDNDAFAAAGFPVGFTISSAGSVPFRLNSMYLYLADHAANVNVSGSLTIVGKLGGTTKFTATASSGFNTNGGVANGFSFINMATFGGSNNTAISIDQIVITTGNSFYYVALDAFTWTTAPTLSATQSQTNLLCNGVCNGGASVTVTGGTTPYTYSWAPSGGASSTVSSLCAGNYTCTITDAALISVTQTFTITQPSALAVSALSQTNISCNGGSNGAASVSTSGGTTSYTYNWTPGNPTGDGTASVTGLTAGSWTCTVTDANTCTKTQTFTITQPSTITSSVSSQTNVSCNGGSNGAATVSASGGTGTLSYSWSPSGGTSATGSSLTAGNYVCTITDANTCTKTQTVTITQPSALTSSISSQINVTCNGGNTGAATILASGGTVTYTYSWLPTGGTTTVATSLTAQTYTCTIIDANNCIATQTVAITQPAAIASSQSVTICAGESLTVGTSTYTTTGTYIDVLIAANTCDSTVTTNLTVENAIDVTTSLNGATLTANEIGATYQWIDCNNGNALIAGEINQSYTAIQTGSYAVIITLNNCTDTSTCVNISVTDISTINNSEQLIIYPNPSIGTLTLTAQAEGIYKIENELGQIIRTVKLNASNNYTAPIENLNNGVYFISGLNTHNETITRQKVIVIR